jgi:murein DD-endopeptidase MepM/ murein hydrolase activator NlpD
LALALGLKTLALGLPILVAFVILTALASGVIEDEAWRWAGGLVICLGLPLFVRWRIAAFLTKRKFRAPSLSLFVAGSNLVIAAAMAFGFADDVGRALRRHGDWFVGERNGAIVRSYRATVERAAAYLEKFDPQPELAPVILPPDLADVPAGPWRPGEKPPEPNPTTVAWFHPLAGPRRAMPGNESRRFGAVRPQPRPPECELGHCGVDVGGSVGEPVFASFDGVVEKIERDEMEGGRAGRYVRLGHKNGTVTTRYIHLDTVRADLKEGDHVKGGEVIGRLGHSGILHSAPHLHFGVSLRPGGRGGDEHYIDPEPLLRTWQLPDPASALRQVATASR